MDKGMKVGVDQHGNLLCQKDFLNQTNIVSKEEKENIKEENDADSGFESEISMEDIHKDMKNDCNKSFEEEIDFFSKEDKSDNEDDKDSHDKKKGKDGKRRGPRTTVKPKQME